MGPRLPPELGYGPPWFESGGQGNLSELPNLRPVPDFPGAPRDHVRIGGESYPMDYEEPPITNISNQVQYTPYTMGDIFAEIQNKIGPSILLAGGVVVSIFAEMVSEKQKAFLLPLGLVGIGAGLYGFIAMPTTPQASAKSAFIQPGLLQNTQVHTQKYVNPVNNLQDVKPINRFDLQTNYVMNKPDDSFDSRINDLILKEAKNMGFGTAGNYPVKVDPWKVKTLIPTTQVEPARDFNTVKMIG